MSPLTSMPRPPRWRRVLRATGVVAAIIVVFAMVSTVANAAITTTEKASLAPYGHTVSIEAGDINVHRNGGTGPTMVLLSGYGTAAPAIDFAPLIRELDAFDVIVIEGFGYGYSDLTVGGRTIENITTEIHDVLGQLDVSTPVTMVGHSAGGLYTRYYANAYPGEVAAIIGIDPMTAAKSSLEAGAPSGLSGALTTLGLVRLANTISPALVQPNGTDYTPNERERMAAMANWNFGNLAVSDEWAQLAANSTKAAQSPLPADVPVLEMLSTESVDSIPGWLANHEAELAGVTTHQLDVITGAHYLHWTQAPLVGSTISKFIDANVSQ